MPTEKPISPVSPDWSHELALLAQSPMWEGVRGQQAKNAFMDEAEGYGSYEALPPRLQRVYEHAASRLPRQRGLHGHHKA